MRWTIELGKAFGIRIRLHLSFLLLLAYVMISGFTALDGGLSVKLLAALWAGCLVATAFSLVVMHELAHSLTARFFGIGVKDILLLPIGGVARLERMPSNPRREIAIAAAGPASNLILAVLLSPIFLILPENLLGEFFRTVYAVNLFLGLFNLLPAFPMDGGRILRALLVARYGYLDATILAARAGRILAVGLAILGPLVDRPWLAVVAIFVFLAGRQEENATRRRDKERVNSHQNQAPPAGTNPPTPQKPTVDEAIARLRRASELLRQDPRFNDSSSKN